MGELESDKTECFCSLLFLKNAFLLLLLDSLPEQPKREAALAVR